VLPLSLRVSSLDRCSGYQILREQCVCVFACVCVWMGICGGGERGKKGLSEMRMGRESNEG
jgi:hypothetical protein